MKLFDEMEKCFPEIEKQWDEYFEILADYYFTPSVIDGVKWELCQWISERFLNPEGELYSLFQQAGIDQPKSMGMLMIEWMHYVRRSEGRPYINPTDTLPVRE